MFDYSDESDREEVRENARFLRDTYSDSQDLEPESGAGVLRDAGRLRRPQNTVSGRGVRADVLRDPWSVRGSAQQRFPAERGRAFHGADVLQGHVARRFEPGSSLRQPPIGGRVTGKPLPRVGERLLSRPDRVVYAILFLVLLIAIFGVDTRP